MKQFAVHSVSRDRRAIRIRREGQDGYDVAHLTQGLQTLPPGAYIEKSDLKRYDFIFSYKQIAGATDEASTIRTVQQEPPQTEVKETEERETAPKIPPEASSEKSSGNQSKSSKSKGH